MSSGPTRCSAAPRWQRQPPYGKSAFFSHAMGALLKPLGHNATEIIETVALLLHIGVMLVFLLIVLHSKHLHIGPPRST